MAKRLTLTDEIKKLIFAAVGDEIDLTQIAAYEAVAASTRPISQRTSAYHGAQMTQSFLQEMVTHLGDESVPLQVMHNGQMLPVGKVFHAAVLDAEQGHHDLNVLFYVDAEDEYARKIDLGTLDEVSVGALPLHAYCSECDFDYMAEGNEMNFYYRECDNGHEIGRDGVHLRLTGLDSWKELSLVNKGASDKPKILGSAKQRLSKESYEQLAASHGGPGFELSYLLCSPTPNDDIGEEMNLEHLTSQVTQLSAAKGSLETKLELKQNELQAAQDQVAALQEKLDNAEALLASQTESESQKKLSQVEAQLAEMQPLVEEFDKQVKLAATAAEIDLPDDATTEVKLSVLEKAQIKLSAIPRKGVSAPVGTTDDLNLSAAVAEGRNAVFTSN